MINRTMLKLIFIIITLVFLAACRQNDVSNNYQLGSICGESDLKYLHEFNEKSGITKEFIAAHSPQVAISMVEGGSKKYCSGTMISEDLYLTANHCSSIKKGDFIAFEFEHDPLGNKKDAKNFKVAKKVESNKGWLDYAIFEIEGKPGAIYGFTPPLVREAKRGEILTIIQHPANRYKQVDVGSFASRSKKLLSYVVDTMPGSSGSGVIAFSDKEKTKGGIIAVHTLGGCSSNGGSNSGVPMTEIAKVSDVIPKLIENLSFK